MAFDLWLTYALACSVLLILPGPTVMIVVSYALAKGRSSAWATVPGVTLGDFTAMTVSVLGAGAILATSATLFTALKLFGALYLIWLGVKLWRTNPGMEAMSLSKKSVQRRHMCLNAYIVTALNPKSIAFFIAFVPQFIDPTAPFVEQITILEITYVTLAGVNAATWAILTDKIHARIERPDTLRLINRIGGSFLIAAGLFTATVRRVS